MADTGPGSNPDFNDYQTDHSITAQFSQYFSLAKCIAWWGLWLIACAYALMRRKVVSRAWFIYTALVIIICADGIESSASLGWATHRVKGHEGTVAYLLYLLFFNVSRSMFLAVLLVIASGYCITRSDLGPHKQHVIFVPTVVLVTGLITDFSFYALASSPSSDNYDLYDLNTLAASVWFVCAVLNLAALILSWLYMFEALSREISSLEEDYKRRTGQLSEEPGADNPFTDAYAPLGLGPVPAKVPPPRTAALDLETAEGDDGQTVAEHLAYTAKKKLLARFSLGVSSYLAAEICVILLPLFINVVVQSMVAVLQFVMYFIFMILLLIIFRPQGESSYLMIGFSEEDAEERGVNNLLTGIAMDSLEGRNGHSGAAGDAGTSTQGSGGTAGPSVSSPAPSRAARKAQVDSERYRQIPSAPQGPAVLPLPAGNQFGALPVSSHPGAGSAADSAAGPAAAPARGARRGPQPRSRPPIQAVQPSSDAGQFTLCSDDEEGDDASHPLTRPRK